MTILETEILKGEMLGDTLSMGAVQGQNSDRRRLIVFLSAGIELDSIAPGPGVIESDRRSIGDTA